MKALTFWFDVISPYAWLAFERLPQALEGIHHEVTYRPVLLAGLLRHWGHKGPAELPTKRLWTYRHVAWLAHEQGTVLRMPAVHPFNPLGLLRLALACAGPGATPNRRCVEAVMRHAWCSGGDAAAQTGIEALADSLGPVRDAAGDEVKAELRAHTEAAIAAGVFGVPTIEVDGRLFWGLDALPMLAAALRDDPWFGSPAWDEAGQTRPAVVR